MNTTDWRGMCDEPLGELQNAIAVHYGEGGTHHISAADRSKRPFSLEPIPLIERGPDCFGSMCWFYESCDESWDYMDCYSMNLERPGHGWTHWLPGHAFPLPPEDV